MNSIRQILPDHVIEGACRECRHVYRHRLLTPTVIVLHLIMAAIWPEESFNACWQVIWAAVAAWNPDLAGLSPARGSASTARNRLPREVMDKIVHWLSQQTQRLSAPYDQWRGHRVVLADGTCLTAPDEPQLHQEFGKQVNSHGPRRYPLVRLVSLCLRHTMTVLSYRIGSYATDENVLLAPQLNALQEGDLLVADRHFAGAHFYYAYRCSRRRPVHEPDPHLRTEQGQPVRLSGPTSEKRPNRRINPRRLDALELLRHAPKHRRPEINSIFFSPAERTQLIQYEINIP